MLNSQLAARAATGTLGKPVNTVVEVDIDGQTVEIDIPFEPKDSRFEKEIDRRARAIRKDMIEKGLIKKPAPAKQPQQATQQSILGGTVFDPSRKAQKPQQPTRKPTPKENAEQAARNVIQSKTGKEFIQRTKELGDAQNRAAMADAGMRPSNEGDPSLTGAEGIGSGAKKLGSRVRINPQTGQPEKDIFGQPIIEGTAFSQARKGAAKGLGKMLLGGVDQVSPVLQNIPEADRNQAKEAVGSLLLDLAGIDDSYSGTTFGLAMGYGLGAAAGPIARAVTKAYQGVKRVAKGIPAGFKEEDWGRQLGKMLSTDEGRAQLKAIAPEAAKEIDEVAKAQKGFVPKPDPSYNPGQTPDLVALARTGQPPVSKPIPGSSPELQGPPTRPIPDIPAPVAQIATPPASTPIPGSSPELQGPGFVKPVQKLDRTVADASPDLTSGRNAMTNNDRIIFGLEPIQKPETVSFSKNLENARRRQLNTDEAALTNATAAIESGRILNADESAGIIDALAGIKQRDDALLAQIAKETDPVRIAELQAQRGMLTDKADTLTRGLNATGTETARALAVRRLTLNEALDPVSLKVEAKAKAGRPLTAEEDAYFDSLGIELQTLQKQLDEANAAKEAAEKAAELARAQQVTVDLSRIDINARRRSANLRRMAESGGRISARFEQLAKEQLSSMGAGPDLTAYTAFLKDIAPDVMVIVKALAENGVTVLDDVVTKTKEEILRLTNGKLELKDEDVVGIIGGKYRETRPVSEQRKAVANLRSDARKMLDQEERDAVKALREAKASEKAQRNAELQAVRKRKAEEAEAWKAEQARLDRARKKELAEAVAQGKALTRQERAEYEAWWRKEFASMDAADKQAFREWQAAEREAAALERTKLDAARKAGAQQAADVRKEYARWWTENVPNEAAQQRKSYIQWWNETAPAEAERLQRQIERHEAFLAEPKLPEPKKKAPEFDENEELRIRLAAKKVERDQELLKLSTPETPLWRKALDAPREIKASFDLGAAFNQGTYYMLSNPKEWLTSFKHMIQYVTTGVRMSDETFRRAIARIRVNKYYEAAKAAKLAISDTGLITQAEERVVNGFFDKVPGFERSNRAYAVFVQDLRMNMFAKLVEGSEVAYGRKLKLDELKQIAEYVNFSTGKGTGAAAKAVQGLPLFAGGFTISRFQTLGTLLYAKSYKKMNPYLAKKMRQDFFKVAGAIFVAVKSAQMAGLEVDTDWNSSKFAHVKVGNTYIDLGGGLLKPVILIGQAIEGVKTMSGQTMPPDPLKAVANYFAGRTSPVYSTGDAVVRGQSFGEPMNPTNADGLGNIAKKLLLPIYIEQVTKNIQDETLTPEEKWAMSVLQLFNVPIKSQKRDEADPEKSKPLAKSLRDLLAPVLGQQ